MTAFEVFKSFYKSRMGTEWTFGEFADWAFTPIHELYLNKGFILPATVYAKTPTAASLILAAKIANMSWKKFYTKSNQPPYNPEAPTFALILLALFVETFGGFSKDQLDLYEIDHLLSLRKYDEALAYLKASKTTGTTTSAPSPEVKALVLDISTRVDRLKSII